MAKMHLDRHDGPSKKSLFPSSLLDGCQNVGDIVSAKTNLPEQLPDLQALQLVKLRHRQERISNEKQEAQDAASICQASSSVQQREFFERHWSEMQRGSGIGQENTWLSCNAQVLPLAINEFIPPASELAKD